MTEHDWLVCTDARPMLQHLRGRATDRKLRLFAVACCRRVWHLLPHEATRRATEVVERFADGLASAEELEAACRAADQVADGAGNAVDPVAIDEGAPAPLLDALSAVCGAAYAVFWAAYDSERIRNVEVVAEAVVDALGTAARVSSDTLADVLAHPPTKLLGQLAAPLAAIQWQAEPDPWAAESAVAVADQPGEAWEVERAERIAQARLLREVFGSSLRPALFNPRWRAPEVEALATVIYREQRFADLPLLADALEEAGCGEEAILEHLHSAGPHVRGCWALDLVLGKK
jgi:hypothetical protein